MNRKTKIKIDNVSKIFKAKKGKEVHALDKINLEIYENEFLTVVGPSGCGKSTLLFMIAGTEEPTSGAIYYEKNKIIGPSAERGVVFQADAVFPWMTVLQNIAYGPRIKGLAKEKVRKMAKNYIDIVGLNNFEDSWPKHLSGGMKKRVDLARTLVNDPDVLLMDEPFGSLDVLTKQKLQVEIGNIFNKFKKTIFFVTHDLEEAIFLSDRVILITGRPGRIKKIIKIDFKRPRQPNIKTSSEFQKVRAELNNDIGEL